MTAFGQPRSAVQAGAAAWSRRAAGVTLAVALAGVGMGVTAAPASACQPESCPQPSPVCTVLETQPKLPQCVKPY